MARLNASDNGFIDANNWLFTARGIPAIYYGSETGSETGFESGKAEHEGNRNYYGQQRIDGASKSPIYPQLKRIAQLRERTPALQRGLILSIHFAGNQAAFYRVYQKGNVHQIALVLLNKGDDDASFNIHDYLQAGHWRPMLGGTAIDVTDGGNLRTRVPAHDVQVYLLNASAKRADLVAELTRLMQERGHPER